MATVQEQSFLAVLAGVCVGLGTIVATAVSSGGTLDAGMVRFLSGTDFSVGLMLVIVPGWELSTGNIPMTLGFLTRRVRPLLIARNKIFVRAGSCASALLLAWALSQTGLLRSGQPIGQRAVEVANAKMDLLFWPCFRGGVLRNTLAGLAVIMACSTTTLAAKLLGIYCPIMTFVACSFEHSTANMYFFPAGLLSAGEFGSRFWDMFGNLIPATLGNIVGGLAIIVVHPKNQWRMFHSGAKRP